VRMLWSERAQAQVCEIFEYIARDRPMAAERILEGFLERVALLTEFPEQGVAWRLPLVGQAVGLQLEGMGFVVAVPSRRRSLAPRR